MGTAEHDRLCAIFLNKFASVPHSLRSEIIAVIDGQPYTWESVFVEVRGKTELSRKMIDELKKLKIIE